MNARQIIAALRWTYDPEEDMKHCPPRGLEGRYIPDDSEDIDGYSKWDYFPGLHPRDQFANEATARQELRDIYAGPDNWGIGLEI